MAETWVDAPARPTPAPIAVAHRPLELILDPVPMPVPVPVGQLAPPTPSPLATLPTPQWCVLPAIGWQARSGGPASGPGALATTVRCAAEVAEIDALTTTAATTAVATEVDVAMPAESRPKPDTEPEPDTEPDSEPGAGPGPAADQARASLAGALHTPARWASFAVLGAGLWVVLLTTVPRLVGWQPTVITGHSMEPSIDRGDVVVVRPAPASVFVPGAVITFVDINHPGHLITHRIVKVNPDGTLVTKGDHNHDDDPQSLAVANVKGRAVLRVPYVGRPVVWIIDRDWFPLSLTAGLLVGVFRTALHPAGTRRRRRPWPLFTAPEPGT